MGIPHSELKLSLPPSLCSKKAIAIIAMIHQSIIKGLFIFSHPRKTPNYTPKQPLSPKLKYKNLIKKEILKRKKDLEAVLPATINIRHQLIKLVRSQRQLEKILEDDTKVLVTAQKWVIFDMQSNRPIKGYKCKKQHDVASLSKIMTFYTTFMIIKRYFLSLDKLYFSSDEVDAKMGGTRIKLQNQCLINLEDLLYALMLNSANDAATMIATNLGSLVGKKRQNGYFSCFDIKNQDKHKNVKVFVQLMNSFASELNMESSHFDNPHGMYKNKSTAKDIGLLLSQCFKIPFFSKIVNTKTHTLKMKYISNEGMEKVKEIGLKNTNKLLWLNSGCIGGKTGCNLIGGDSLAACYEGNIIIVVLGSHGSQEKFADCQRLIQWLYTKLKQK